MLICRVVGDVTSTAKDSKLANVKFLIVEKLNPASLEASNSHLIAIDSVGAGRGDVVMIVQGSSARMTDLTNGKPCDASIMAIIEQMSVSGELCYNKSEDDY